MGQERALRATIRGLGLVSSPENIGFLLPAGQALNLHKLASMYDQSSQYTNIFGNITMRWYKEFQHTNGFETCHRLYNTTMCVLSVKLFIEANESI